MLRVSNISQARHQRTLRANYAHTQGYPYAAFFAPTLANGSTAFVKGSGEEPGAAGQGPIMPGMVAALLEGETVCVSVGGTDLKPFGFFGNYIGGDFDEVGESTEVGIWRGAGSTYEVLAPVFNANITAARDGDSDDRRLYVDADGLLNITAVDSGPQVASLLSWVSASKILVEWTYTTP